MSSMSAAGVVSIASARRASTATVTPVRPVSIHSGGALETDHNARW